MITCALVSAANEPTRLLPGNRAWLRHVELSEDSAKEAAPFEASAKEGDETLDTPVSNISTTILRGDSHGMPLPMGNGSKSQPSRRKKICRSPAGT
jgi:hypothetical protein